MANQATEQSWTVFSMMYTLHKDFLDFNMITSERQYFHIFHNFLSLIKHFYGDFSMFSDPLIGTQSKLCNPQRNRTQLSGAQTAEIPAHWGEGQNGREGKGGRRADSHCPQRKWGGNVTTRPCVKMTSIIHQVSIKLQKKQTVTFYIISLKTSFCKKIPINNGRCLLHSLFLLAIKCCLS